MPSLKTNFEELIERMRHGRDLGHASFEPIYYLVFTPVDNDYAWMCRRLPQIIGWLRDLEAEYWRRDEILEKFKKVKGLQVLRELMPAVFRAGFLYAEKIRHEGEANLTRFDEEDN